MMADYALAAAFAVTFPGLLAWLAARRWGLAGIIAALAVCAVAALIGRNVTADVLTGDDQLRRAGWIYFVILPGVVSLVLGAVAGFWTAHRRRLDG